MIKFQKRFDLWAKSHLGGIFVFNLIVLWMVLLNTADYFKPYFFLNINAITFISMIMAIVLLDITEKTLFAIAIAFFIMAGFLKITGITVWADRSMIYVYQSLILGFALLSKNVFLYNNFALGKKTQKMKGKLGSIKELVVFLWRRKLWWLIPMFVVFFAIGILIIFVGSSPLAPIVYPLF